METIKEAKEKVAEIVKENKALIQESRKDAKERAVDVTELVKSFKDESVKRKASWKECLKIIQAGKRKLQNK